jgi:hypothetical protein
MSQEWWTPIVQWSLWGIVMAIVMGWVARSRLRGRPLAERRTLRHPLSTLLIGIVVGVFFFGIAIISNTVGKNATTTLWTTSLFLAFGLASLPLIADYFFARHRVSEAGIEYGRMLGQRGSLLWTDVQRIRFAYVMKWFVLERRSGTPVRISAMHMGLPEFARLALLRAPAQSIDQETRIILEETRDGRPPSVWR